jgi:hypothetical protein
VELERSALCDHVALIAQAAPSDLHPSTPGGVIFDPSPPPVFPPLYLTLRTLLI